MMRDAFLSVKQKLPFREAREKAVLCKYVMVGVAGFEPTTSPTPRVRATSLRYTPKEYESDYSTGHRLFATLKPSQN